MGALPVGLLLRLGRPDPAATPGQMAEGMPVVIWTDLPVTLADGTIVPLRAPSYGLPGPAFGPLAPDTVLAPRIAPQRIGLCLPEAIPAADILAREDRGDRDGDGISGRANQNGAQLGRF